MLNHILILNGLECILVESHCLRSLGSLEFGSLRVHQVNFEVFVKQSELLSFRNFNFIISFIGVNCGKTEFTIRLNCVPLCLLLHVICSF